MKKLYLLLPMFCVATLSVAQKLEFSAQLTGGISRFGGASAGKETFILVSDRTNIAPYTNNPYGSKYGLNDGVGVQAQLITGRFLLGTQLTAEQVRSRIAITLINAYDYSYPGDGHTTLRCDFINLNPYVGWRLHRGRTDVDLTLGMDIGFFMKTWEKGETDQGANGGKITTSLERSKPDIPDLRPRIGLTAYRRHLGFSLSYAYGLTNYTAGYDGINSEVYSRVLRLGLLYRL